MAGERQIKTMLPSEHGALSEIVVLHRPFENECVQSLTESKPLTFSPMAQSGSLARCWIQGYRKGSPNLE
jgi:hypothetical protein